MNAKRERNRQIQAVEIIPVVSGTKYLALSFVFPIMILGTVFAIHGVYPFGNKQILIGDFFHQYYPFLSNLWHKLREGGVSPWSWTAGGGHDYAALTAYYMASPLNLFALILPHAWLRETLTLVLLVRVGCAGLFTGIFLNSAFKQKGTTLATMDGGVSRAKAEGFCLEFCHRQNSEADNRQGCRLSALPFFSSLYALCEFTLGYYSNIIWFDSFALLPLVALGGVRLVNEGKYRLYVVSLALSVFTNFYMGIFVCIFAVLAFLGLCIIRKLKLRDFLRRLGLIAGCSALALGMVAVILIPSWSALQNTYGAETAFPAKMALYTSFFNILGNFIAFTPPTYFDGLPNLYCGMISILLAGLFIYSPKISRREKLVFAGTLVFLLISCNLNTLDYIMHGFRYPTALPSRFSFLLSFILVAAAYRAFLLTEDMNRRGILAMGASAAIFLLAAVFGSQGKGSVIGSVVLCIFYLLVIYIFAVVRTAKGRTIIRIVFLAAVLTELSITSYIAIKTMGLTGRDTYPDGYEQIRALLDMRRPSGDPTGTDFYRTDIDYLNSYNDPFVYNYNGISFFSSTVNESVAGFMQGLGMRCGEKVNYFIYNEATPLVNAFLNMRYMIGLRDNPAGNSAYWETVGKAGNLELLENNHYLPLGFMVNEDIISYAHNNNPLLSQNDLFRRATGLDGFLFTIIDISALAQKDNEGRTNWSIKTPFDEPLYAYCTISDGFNELMEISVNGPVTQIIRIFNNVPYIFPVGTFSRGDNVFFSLITDKASIYLGFLNSSVFERGYALLSDETWNLTKFTDTKVSGNVTALKDGILYTSIPGKNWSVFVDGIKDELLLIDNAMAAVRLSEGTHTVEFRYFNKSLLAGIIVSLASLAVFAALVLRNTLKRRKKGSRDRGMCEYEA